MEKTQVEFFKAIDDGAVAQIVSLLTAQPQLAKYSGGRNTVNGLPNMPLHRVVLSNNLTDIQTAKLVMLLLQCGANIKERDLWHSDLIAQAARVSKRETIELLLRSGLDLVVEDALELVSAELHIPCNRLTNAKITILAHQLELLDYIVSENSKLLDEVLSSVYEAAKYYDGRCVQYKLDVNYDCGMHNMPILVAAACNSLEPMQVLLKHGAAVNKVSMVDGIAALQVAMEKNNTKMVQLLLKSGAKVKYPENLKVSDEISKIIAEHTKPRSLAAYHLRSEATVAVQPVRKKRKKSPQQGL